MYLSTTLCLACSSSLPPPKRSTSQSSIGVLSQPALFTTPCCQRLICSSCIKANPRLQRYNPCLACLGGVALVRSTPSLPTSSVTHNRVANVDGAVRDRDTFVLGDDEDEDSEAELDEKLETDGAAEPSPPAKAIQRPSTPHEDLEIQHPIPSAGSPDSKEEPVTAASQSTPLKYHITKTDTLQGIVLRFRVDPYELCRLNNLPPSTLSTTPHLLHTRRFLLLPPSAHQAPIYREPPEVARAREERRGRERAEKRLQTMTKEVDWRVAKAYVALAEDQEEEEEGARKMKEQGMGRTTLEARAIERYFDDDEWEAGQRQVGGSTSGMVSSCGRSKDNEKEGDGRWWKWGSG
ncbi:hypothetical protein Hypma_006844 [Hypsizygus marmoreus]|uniref:LysM domain-containing protein n=1 Tax=Hypsizygus marmoreus TaxID=39966 RepID=A0A369JXZ2_HYPMA|nr:hypothetical protein Hypma_006844 [Hypsizygus marmoreus]